MTDPKEPLAIVGLGCRFPGAEDGCAYWRLLEEGREASGGLAEGRIALGPDPERLRDGELGELIRSGRYLDGLDRFDPLFFDISPREAQLLDPQQRLLLETAWEALEDAGVHPAALRGSRTGVVMGLWSGDYERRVETEAGEVDLHAATGGGRFSAAGRLSYFFDLRGPSLTVDTATSSSLAAVYLACEAIRSGQCEMALAGGANVMLDESRTAIFGRSGMLSASGRCRFGDGGADGFVRSEGTGVVLLMRLSAAREAGAPIYAVIRGGAMNNDGRASGHLVRPAREAQAALVRDAWEAAGLEPAQAQYVEAHGTGTPAGDPVELEALAEAFGPRGDRAWRCRVGSGKSNIGHTEAAAGVAGLIKLALAMKHGRIPASLHVDRPTEAVIWAGAPIELARETIEWPEKSRRLGGVSSFGLTGTNVHLVLEHRPEFDEARAAHTSPEGVTEKQADERPQLVVVSGRSEGALIANIRRLHDFLNEASSEVRLADFAHTLARRRAIHEHRLAIAASSPAELAAELQTAGRGEPGTWSVRGQISAEKARVVFVFSGQGPKFEAPGRELLDEEPVFLHTMEACAEALDPLTGWSLMEAANGLDSERSARADVVQPLLFAVQVSLAELWRSWGIEPAAVVGHSVGEVAAACVAGALDLDEAAKVIFHRGRLIQRELGKGRMAVVALPAAQAEARLKDYAGRIDVAVENSPGTVVVSGETAGLREWMDALEKEGVFCRMLEAVDYASHGPGMEACRRGMEESLQGLKVKPPRVPVISTVRGGAANEGDFGPAYWGRNVRERVRFAEAMAQLAGAGFDAFVEIGPHPMLVTAMEECLEHAGREGVVVGSLRRDEPERRTLLRSLGELVVQGAQPDWEAVIGAGARFIKLPHYAWDRRSYWYKQIAGAQGAESEGGAAGAIPGVETPEAASGGGLRELARLPEGRSRTMALQRLLTEQLSAVLRLGAEQVEIGRPFKHLGLDSLLGNELRRRLEARLDLRIGPTAIWNHPTAQALAEFLAEKVDDRLRREVARTDRLEENEIAGGARTGEAARSARIPKPVSAEEERELERLVEEIEKLSDEEVRRLLADERGTAKHA